MDRSGNRQSVPRGQTGCLLHQCRSKPQSELPGITGYHGVDSPNRSHNPKMRAPATLRSRPRSAPAQLPSSQVASRVAGGQAPRRLEPHGVVSRSATPLRSRPHRFGLGSRTAVSQSGLPALICVIRPPAVLARRRGSRTYAGERRATLTLPATQLRACWAARDEPEEARCGARRVVFTPPGGLCSLNCLDCVHSSGERATGIEPAFSAWEADVLPLYDARVVMRQACYQTT